METSGIIAEHNTDLQRRVNDLCKLCPSLFISETTVNGCIKMPQVWEICWIFNPNQINSSFYALHSRVQDNRMGDNKLPISLIDWYEHWVQQAADTHRSIIYVPIAILVEEKSKFPLMIFAGNNKRICYLCPYVDCDIDQGLNYLAYEFLLTLEGVDFEMEYKMLLTERGVIEGLNSQLYSQMCRTRYQYTYVMYDNIREIYINQLLNWIRSYKPKKK